MPLTHAHAHNAEDAHDATAPMAHDEDGDAMKKRSSARRAYVLMEAMIGGAMLALILAATFTIIAQARADVTYAERRQAAGALCRMLLDDLSTQTVLVNQTQATIAVDPANYPGITADWTVTDSTATYAGFSPAPAFGLGAGRQLFEIRVNVHYPTPQGTKTFSQMILRER